MTGNHLIIFFRKLSGKCCEGVNKVGKQKKRVSKDKGSSQYQDSEKQGHRFLYVWLPVIVVVVLSFYVLMFDPSRPVGQPIPGTARDTQQAQLGESNGNAYRVVLDDGRMVTIEGSLMASLKAGRRVLVQENKTLIFKRKYFSFVRYLE
jgi:hypothetical protein